ncbi:MAG: hypothetical protein ACYDCK_14990 [Thermoplasmatota archaeon]
MNTLLGILVAVAADSASFVPCPSGAPCPTASAAAIFFLGTSPTDGGEAYGFSVNELAWCVPVDAPYACESLI